MTAPLQLLLMEDSVEDAELVLLHLASHGLACTSRREDTLEGFLEAFSAQHWDLVLSDFDLLGTTGMDVLKCLRDLDSNLPFILLSGVLDEGAAVDAMRAGANDFLLKGNLARLVPAIERELKESELRRRQQQFEEELRLLHTAIGQTPDMVVITDAEGVILYANGAAEAITGYRREELLGQNPRLLKSGHHGPEFYRSLWETLVRGDTWKGHLVNKRKDGALWDAEMVITPVFNAQGGLSHYLSTARDITLERQLQGLLEQSQRLETIGTLTSGIAHDFNNILMPVLGHAELGLMREPGDPKLKHDLEVIHASAERARDLVRQILTFSRKGEGDPVAVEVQVLLAESLKLLRASLPTSIGFEVDMDAKGLFTQGEPTKLHQVILNLCTNAAHAMRGTAGRLTVRLHAQQQPALPCAMNIELPPGQYLCLEVTDTGKGIPAENLVKIFLPFFSTKPPQEGTGLGLSVTHGIVTEMGGGLQVESVEGQGTTFLVYLPVSAVSVPQAQERDPGVPQGHGHLLVVDDEEPLLEMLHGSLVALGFRVTSHHDPLMALRTFMAAPWDFQALVTDQTMPGMSGIQLAQALHQVRPALPAFLLTGDPEVAQAHERGEVAGFHAVLAKPMSARDLARVVLQELDQRQRVHVVEGASGAWRVQP